MSPLELQNTPDVVRSIRGFVAVPTSVLRAMRDPGCDVYVCGEHRDRPVLYWACGYSITAHEYEELLKRGIGTLYIKNSDQPGFESRLKEHLDEFLEADEIEVGERLAVLRSAVELQLRSAFAAIRPDRAIQESEQVGTRIARLLRSSQTIPSRLIAMAQHSGDTFTHMINVASYSVLLADELGTNDEQDLAAIAIGGMLHDLGKRSMPRKILTSQSTLTPRERELIQSHPQFGYEELQSRSGISSGQLMMVYQHHERMDGTGYPVGILGDEIHPWARVCAVVDVFEALTGKRPYRKSSSFDEALATLEEIAGDHLDREMVKCWSTAVRRT
jgi:HD-GYP domain-containing protein (c-di-GMP phosphodiesterase class II)